MESDCFDLAAPGPRFGLRQEERANALTPATNQIAGRGQHELAGAEQEMKGHGGEERGDVGSAYWQGIGPAPSAELGLRERVRVGLGRRRRWQSARHRKKIRIQN